MACPITTQTHYPPNIYRANPLLSYEFEYFTQTTTTTNTQNPNLNFAVKMANVCETCGDEGWVEALIFCDSCKLAAVHRHCCGITPVPIDGYVTWFCSDCDESDSASDSIQVGMSGNEKKKKRRKIVTHSLPDDTIVENMEVSKKQDGSENGESDELVGLARNEVSVLEKSGKKKKNKKTDKGEEKKNEEGSNHVSPVLEAEGDGLQGTTSRSQESSNHTSPVLKVTNEESSNHTALVLAAKDNVACDTTDNVEPAKAQESSASRKPHGPAGLEKNEASVSEDGNSTNVPDDNSCTTSKKRRLSSGNTHVTSENMELPSCKETESNMPQTNEVMLALNNGRAQPICTPVWRGSVTVKQGNNCSIHGLVAHVSNLACPKVYEKASSLRTRLSAEMLPRLEIWPPSFLKNGPPTDDSIALYFFPSHDSNSENLYYSLVDEMKKKDLGMRCLLDDAELLLFTSYQLPLPCWKFHLKEYLWGVFRRRKTSGH
ncbi:BnaA06g03130D [Brassica napus]|uniref:BnaA06g03130D protein n=1 Tax=Brassica napus TaxID=3708 RepID=A0A078IHI9_BRANA|nr:BnaA06g03130D [Brassica napus]